MAVKQADPLTVRGTKRSLSRRILRNTTLNILILVVICCVIMAISLQSLANNILLDSLQPMARQSAKTVEANVHMLADRMVAIAADSRMNADPVSDETRGFLLTLRRFRKTAGQCWRKRRRFMSFTRSLCMIWTGGCCRGPATRRKNWTAVFTHF